MDMWMLCDLKIQQLKTRSIIGTDISDFVNHLESQKIFWESEINQILTPDGK